VHCVAMCGGIALSQSALFQGVGQAEKKKLLPGLLYNGGRVISYTLIGGAVGALGSAFDFSPLIKGIIAAVAGVFMIIMGLKIMGLLSRLPSIRALLPGLRQKKSGPFKALAGRGGPLVVGLLNGLMPCGPLQMMQLYALGSGSALAGAFSMFLFSLGTVPLLLGFSVAAAVLPRKVVPIMLKASAVLVMFLGILTLGRSAALAGVSLPFGRNSGPVEPTAVLASAAASAEPKAVLEKGVQTARTVFGPNNYVSFTVQAEVPLRWIITIAAKDLNGCNNAIIVPSYGIKKSLVPGENIVEFTPKKDGVIPYSCWMGMIRSRITVVSNLSDASGPSLIPDGQIFPAFEEGIPAGPACSSCGG